MPGMEFDFAALVNTAPATVLALICIVEMRALRPVQQGILMVLSALLERERAKERQASGENIAIPRVPTLKKIKTGPHGVPVRKSDAWNTGDDDD